MIDYVSTFEEKKELDEAFNLLNISNNGYLTREELKIAYGDIYQDFPEYEKKVQVDEIFDRIEIDQSGSID
jgi:Ca2+-binding EF-hand superfamily protein